MSVDSCTVDIEDWQGADSCTVGDVGGGLLGSEMVVGGFLHGDLTLPADANKEICGRITYWPPGLDLRTDEDGGYIASANDGTYVAQYQLYVDYVATGPVTSLTFAFGTGAVSAVIAWTEGSEVFAASGTVAPPTRTAVISWTEGSETFAMTGTVSAPGANALSIGWTEGSEVFAIIGNVEITEGSMSFTPSVARTITVSASGTPFSTTSSFWNLADSKKPRGWKDPDATIDITFDWGPWLADIADTIRAGGLEFIVDGGLVSAGSTFVDAKCTIFLSAGTAPLGSSITRAPVTCRITTSSTPPRIEDRTAYLDIEAR